MSKVDDVPPTTIADTTVDTEVTSAHDHDRDHDSDIGKKSKIVDEEKQTSAKGGFIEWIQDKDGFTRIGWDDQDDPCNPKNFTFRRRWFITSIVSFYGIVSPLTSSMLAPCILVISRDLHVTQSFQMNMLVSIYLLGYVVGPFFLGPLSEVYGRRPLLMASNIVFIAYNIGCSQAHSFSQLAAFRFLSGVGGAGPITIGGGVLGDLWSADERGRASALYSLGPLLGPCLGPIAGGFIAEYTSWRWVFYIVIIVGTLAATFGAIFLPETYAPVLIQKKVDKLRKDTGNNMLKSKFEKDETPTQILYRALFRPIILLATQPIIMVLTLYQSIILGTYYILIVLFTRVFMATYNESVSIASLNYLSLALGFITGRQIGTRIMDKSYRKLKARNGGIGTPEMRLLIFAGPTILIPSGMLIYGWSLQYKVHWIVPDIGAFIFGAGVMCVTFVINAYILDVYTLYAASALAAINSVRSIFGFGFPLFASDMYDRLGQGWGNSLLAFVVFLLGGPGTMLLYHYGPRLRARSTFAAGGGD